jgi:hypothetical protein
VQKDGSGNSSGASFDAGSNKSQHGKSVLYHTLALELLHEADHMADKGEEEEATGGDAPDSEPPLPIMHEAQLAAIPECETPGRRSKRRAELENESSMECAERMKATSNLDFKGIIPRYSLASVLGSNGMV